MSRRAIPFTTFTLLLLASSCYAQNAPNGINQSGPNAQGTVNNYYNGDQPDFTKPPRVRVKVLPEAQGLSVGSSLDTGKGFSRYDWDAAFEVSNLGARDVTITGLENLFDARDSVLSLDFLKSNITIHQVLKQIDDPPYYITIYDTLEGIHERKQGLEEQLPYTIKAGTKKYIEFSNQYELQRLGITMYCKDEDKCNKALTTYFAGDMRCVPTKFRTRIDYYEYPSQTTEQEAILMVPGCIIHIPRLKQPQRNSN